MKVPNPVIDEIIQKNDIVDIVSEYVKLERKGKNFFGVCPFHDEKTPSFSVAPEKQIFHCFSCGVGGNVISFLEKIEKISFQESLNRLAIRANINISETFGHNNYRNDLKYFEINQFVSDYYQFALENTKEGLEAKAYLKERGIDEDIIKRFKIGLAPEARDSLYQALKANGFSELLMVELGHVVKYKDYYYDKFKNRIMFPIKDENGNIVGFSGRLYKSSDKNEAKYMNTQETPVFKKSHIMYNLSDADHAIREKRMVLLHEGFMDVIASVKSGIDYSVATMGTALTTGHVQLLKRYTNQVLLCYDGDKAGVEATKRALELLQKERMNVSIVSLPEGLDPDDFVVKYGGAKYKEFIESKQLSDKEYLYARHFKNINFSQVKSVENFKKEIFKVILYGSKTEQEFFLRKLSADINISFETLKFDFERYEKYLKTNYENKHLITEKDNGSFDRLVSTINRHNPTEKKLLLAEKTILFMMIMDPKYTALVTNAFKLFNEWHKMLYRDLYEYYTVYTTFDRQTFMDRYIQTKPMDKRESYLDFFLQFYSDYQKEDLGKYTDQHFYECLNVIKKAIVIEIVNSLKVRLNETIDDDERERISMKIMDHYRQIKLN